MQGVILERALVLDGERHGILYIFPHQFNHAATRRVFRYGQRELIERLFRGILLHVHSGQIIFFVYRYTPFSKVFAKHELRLP